MKAVNLEKLLPADIPPGERVLWFGKPDAASLWRRAYRAEWVAAWFGVMTLWNLASATSDAGLFFGFVSAIKTLGFGAAALSILAFLARLSARTTLYVITTKRLVIKSGIALPLFFNVPFKQVGAANLRTFADGTGDVSVGLIKGQRIAYLTIWPSVRPWRFTHSEPTLRCIPNARYIAETLGRALVEASGELPSARPRADKPAGAPAFATTVTA